MVEIAHDLKKGVSDGPDELWGLSWRTPDVAKANARLRAAGVDVSAPRTGRRPYAVLQLRQDNLAGTLYNLVGFQTNLKWDEQRRVFRMIPFGW